MNYRIYKWRVLGVTSVRINMNGALPQFFVTDDFGNLAKTTLGQLDYYCR